MPSVKKHQTARRSGLHNLLFAFFSCSVSLILLRSFFYAVLLLFILVSLSTANVLNIGLRSVIATSYTKINYAERFGGLLLFVSVLLLSVGLFYIVAVLFGAYLFEAFWSTLYFSCFLTILTAYPLSLYRWLDCGTVVNLLNVFMEQRYDGSIEGSLHLIVVSTIVGAWLGAFPIPLDWDRDWQEWPTTCCFGAVLGNAVAYAYLGFTSVWNSYKEKRRLMWNIFV